MHHSYSLYLLYFCIYKICIRVQDGLHNKALFSCKPFLGGAKLLQIKRINKVKLITLFLILHCRQQRTSFYQILTQEKAHIIRTSKSPDTDSLVVAWQGSSLQGRRASRSLVQASAGCAAQSDQCSRYLLGARRWPPSPDWS